MDAGTRGPSGTGRWLGGLIFAVGLLMLIAVFALAAVAFAQVPEVLASGGRSSGQGLVGGLAATGARAAFLLVMAYVSSLVASKGLELYQAARSRGEG